MLIWILSVTASMVFALSKGGRPERIVGVVNVLAWLVSLGLLDRERWFEPQLGVFGVDCVYLAVLLFMALTSTRTWLLFAAAFQLLEVVIHVATLIDPGARTLAYLRGMTICSYLLTFSLVIGAWAYARRAQPLEPDGFSRSLNPALNS